MEIYERPQDIFLRVASFINKGNIEKISIIPKNANCKNYSFDVTPAKYITKIITEKKVVEANESSISDLVVL